MKKVLLLAFTAVLLVVTAQAQKVKGTVKGALQDATTAQPLPDATVSVASALDSSLVSFTLTSGSGYFEINNLDSGAYYLLVSYQGFETLKKPFAVSAANAVTDLLVVKMDRAYKSMDEVVVNDLTPVKVKGDTLAFNANAFKTKPNATAEDLLKKLPGMQVERDGTVKAQGENVQKIYVDGKEFFGNDPKLATKNISADMIAEVEVYDDMSEAAKFNGVDDGSRSKAINLKLKKEKKKGLFGQVSAGYGTDERYNGNLRANFFKGATQVGVFANANNTNRINFTSTDMPGMGGGMAGRGGPGGGGNGITSSWATGINYNDLWSKNVEVNGNYNFNHTGTDNFRRSYRQTFFADSTINRSQNAFSRNESDAHRSNFRITYNVNDRNAIIFTPNVSIQNSENSRNDTTALYTARNGTTYKLNENRSASTSTGNGLNWSNSIIWRKKFAKKGRTLATTLSNTYSNNETNGFNNSVLAYYSEFGKIRDSAFNQQNLRQSNTDNYGIALSYTEPIGRDKIWEVNYGYNNNHNQSDRETFDYDRFSGKYSQYNDSLSNYFDNKNITNRLGTNFRIVKKKYNYQVGVSLQRTLLKSETVRQAKEQFYKRTYTNIFPNASFNYQFARSKSLRFNYRGRTNQPSITQLQDVVELSGATNYTRGNPALDQEFINNFSLNYNFFDPVKFRNIFAAVNFNNTFNKIVNSTEQLGFGKQLSTPVNMNGTYNVNGHFNFGLPIKRMKGGNFNTTTRINFNRDGGMTDLKKFYIHNLSLGEDLRLNYNHKEKLDLGVTAGINYNSVSYTAGIGRNDDYYTHVYSVDGNYIFPKGFILSSDVDYTANTGRSDGFNQSYFMWNASFGKQLFKSKRGELKLSVFDILDQNISLTRNVADNYIEDVQTNVLQRFFMLSFTYNINRMGGKNMPSPAGNREGRRMMIRQ